MAPLPPATASLLAALLAVAPASADDRAAPSAGILLAQSSVTIRSMIVRVPRATPAPEPQRWRTRRGPSCVMLGSIAGAQVMEDESVDLILRGGRRIRAELDRACPALDYYSGFYIRPTQDGKVCADRDAVHARSGGACEIERFRLMVPITRRP